MEKKSDVNWTASEEEILDQHHRWILYMVHLATRNLSRELLARMHDDLVQEASLALLLRWREYKRIKPDISLHGYACARVRGAVIDYYRERRYNTRHGIKTVNMGDKTEEYLNPLAWHDRNADDELDLHAGVSQLADWEQNFLNLLYVQGETLKFIGGLAGVTESRACQIHSAIIKKLRKIMGAPAQEGLRIKAS